LFDFSALSSLLLWSAELRSQQPVQEFELVRHETHGLLDLFYQQALGMSWTKEHADLGRYALCAGIDEAAMTRADAFADRWAGRPLQLSLYGEYTAGRGFFDRLDVLRQDVPSNYAVIMVYWMVLSHGFAGKLALEPESRRDALTRQMKTELMPHLPSSEITFTPVEKKNILPKKKWVFVQAALKPLIWYVALAAIVSAYVFWSHKTKNTLIELSSELNQLKVIDSNRGGDAHVLKN
jgi:type IV/VI secretion system ImpK/VasF family protein